MIRQDIVTRSQTSPEALFDAGLGAANKFSKLTRDQRDATPVPTLNFEGNPIPSEVMEPCDPVNA